MTDSLTGLIWAPDAGSPSIGSCTGGPKTWQGALDYIACINSNKYLGQSDWRLPNLNEVESLIHAGEASAIAWLSSQGFSNVMPDDYWTSTTTTALSELSWVIGLDLSDTAYDYKSYLKNLWPVRGSTTTPAAVWKTGQDISLYTGDDAYVEAGTSWPLPRFITNVDTTITDKLTGLFWAPDAGSPNFGTCTGGPKTWQEALDYVSCLNQNSYLGHKDWRLPNRKELRSLIHYGQANGAEYLNSQGFLNMVSGSYWTSTTSSTLQEEAWMLEMGSGLMAQVSKTATSYPLPVRAGAVCSIADAGPDLSISSDGQYTTIIQGRVYVMNPGIPYFRWLEGQNLLSDWQQVGGNGEAPLSLGPPVPGFSLGAHTLSLEVDDGPCIHRDDMILTVNNSAPHPAPGGGGVCEINTTFALKGQIFDYDGDLVDYEWSEGEALLFGGSIQTIYGGTAVDLQERSYSCLSLGEHTITLSADDRINEPKVSSVNIFVTDTSAPSLSPKPNKNVLWPPNHKMVTVTIQANAIDNSGGPVRLAAAVSSDEPQDGSGDGDTSPDWTEPVIDQLNGTITIELRSERSGTGDGRVYTIRITATDGSGNSSFGDVRINVPHDQGKSSKN